MDVKNIKGDFPQFEANKDLVYLDTAATSLTPQIVIDAVQDYYKNYRASVHRGLYKEAEKATVKFEEARKAVAEFIGAHESEIIFTSGATASSNMLFESLGQEEWGSGDEIVTTAMEHHALLLPLKRFAKESGVSIKTVPLENDYWFDVQKFERHLSPNTKVVAITLASNVLGTTTNIKSLIEKIHSLGAIVVYDATAVVGHMPVDVKELGADYLFFSGHKMCGPTGVGVLYGKKHHLKNLEPAFLGGGMVEDVTPESAVWREEPDKFEAGTPNIAGVIGLERAVFYLKHIGLESIQSHAQSLVRYTKDKLEQIAGVTVFTAPPEENIGILSFSMEGVHPHDIAEILGGRGVAIRAGHHCALPLHKDLGVPATARISFYIYNTESDADAFISGLEEVKKTFSK